MDLAITQLQLTANPPAQNEILFVAFDQRKAVRRVNDPPTRVAWYCHRSAKLRGQPRRRSAEPSRAKLHHNEQSPGIIRNGNGRT
jgi:hypothetical protein